MSEGHHWCWRGDFCTIGTLLELQLDCRLFNAYTAYSTIAATQRSAQSEVEKFACSNKERRRWEVRILHDKSATNLSPLAPGADIGLLIARKQRGRGVVSSLFIILKDPMLSTVPVVSFPAAVGSTSGQMVFRCWQIIQMTLTPLSATLMDMVLHHLKQHALDM